MVADIFDYIVAILRTALTVVNGASVWMVASLFVAGILHEFLNPARMKKLYVGSKSFLGIFFATISGMFIPICSCGTIPLGISMYRSGAYLGPTLAFMTSTPMINPIAIFLAWGLLGKEITIIYVLTGLIAPMVIGAVANHFAGDELYSKEMTLASESRATDLDVRQKIKKGLRWSFSELAISISKYTLSGMIVAGIIFNMFPQSFIQEYLGEPGMVSLFGITVIAGLMYVCAVGHIPFIAALVASGAAPGVAITFLMAGAATNIPELITINKIIGKRAMVIYFSMVILISNAVGYITNYFLLDTFVPAMDFDAVSNTISTANKFILSAPTWLQYGCTGVLVVYAAIGFIRFLQSSFAPKSEEVKKEEST